MDDSSGVSRRGNARRSRRRQNRVGGSWGEVISLASKASRRPRGRRLISVGSYASRLVALAARFAPAARHWQRWVPGWQSHLEVLEPALEEIAKRSYPHSTGEDVREQARKARLLYNALAVLADDPAVGRRAGVRVQFAALRMLQRDVVREIPACSRARTTVLSDPLVNVLGPAVELADTNTRLSLLDKPYWVQLAALVAAETGLLPAAKSQQLLSHTSRAISERVRHALKETRLRAPSGRANDTAASGF